MKSVCCNARPVGWRDYDGLSGTCSKCGKPTAFYREDDEVEQLERELEAIKQARSIEPKYEGFTGIWDMCLDSIFGEDR